VREKGCRLNALWLLSRTAGEGAERSETGEGAGGERKSKKWCAIASLAAARGRTHFARYKRL